MAQTARTEEEQLTKAVVRLNSTVLGMLLGVFFGLGLFAATLWLVIQGGHVTEEGERVVGPHLMLLRNYLPFYRVTYLGSVLGGIYGFAFGTIIGSVIGWIYNKLVDFRTR